MRHHLDRQAAFEELLLVEIVDGRRLGVDERLVEALVFVARQRAVQVVALPIVHAAGRTPVHLRVRSAAGGAGPIPPRRAEDLGAIDRLGEHDRADRVVEIQMLLADEPHQVGRQRIRGERAGGDDHRGIARARFRESS